MSPSLTTMFKKCWGIHMGKGHSTPIRQDGTVCSETSA
jgi:hypothetical protein